MVTLMPEGLGLTPAGPEVGTHCAAQWVAVRHAIAHLHRLGVPGATHGGAPISPHQPADPTDRAASQRPTGGSPA